MNTIVIEMKVATFRFFIVWCACFWYKIL